MNKVKKTHLPALIDTQLVNSTRFLGSLQTLQNNILEFAEFINFYCVASINRTNKQLHDSVTHQVQFFKELNDKALAIKHNKKGVYNDKYLKEQQTVYDDLPEQFGLDDITMNNTEFIVYWVEKYRTSHDLIKQLLHESDMLPKETSSGEYNTDNVYFNDFSESMYSLKATTLYNAPRESLPIWDVKGTLVKEMGGKHTIPNQYTGTSIFNIHKNVQQLAFTSSRTTSCMFRNNMKNILDCVSIDQRVEDPETGELKLKAVKITDSKQPHGGNLVPDSFHISRMWQNAEPLARIMVETLSNMSYVLNYMDKNLRENMQAWGQFKTSTVIEDTIEYVDLLHDTIEYTFSEIPATNLTIQGVLGD